VVDSVHILSEFADTYPRLGDRREAVRVVMRELFQPMLYTSLTSAAGFASLAFTPIPPVQVFGTFVAIGIAWAFILTITFIPAYVVTIDEARIAKLRHAPGPYHDTNPLARLLTWTGAWTLRHAKAVVGVAAVLGAVSVVGISQIRINDNPVRWFRADHKIRVADRVLNEHFAGTYNAFLVLESTADGPNVDRIAADVSAYLADQAAAGAPDLTASWAEALATARAATGVAFWLPSWMRPSGASTRPRPTSRPTSGMPSSCGSRRSRAQRRSSRAPRRSRTWRTCSGRWTSRAWSASRSRSRTS
jgi:predicted RND superfamily exporter protein